MANPTSSPSHCHSPSRVPSYYHSQLITLPPPGIKPASPFHWNHHLQDQPTSTNPLPYRLHPALRTTPRPCMHRVPSHRTRQRPLYPRRMHPPVPTDQHPSAIYIAAYIYVYVWTTWARELITCNERAVPQQRWTPVKQSAQIHALYTTIRIASQYYTCTKHMYVPTSLHIPPPRPPPCSYIIPTRITTHPPLNRTPYIPA